MTAIQAISGFLGLVIALAALALIVKPGGQAAQVLASFGDSTAKLVKAAKGESA